MPWLLIWHSNGILGLSYSTMWVTIYLIYNSIVNWILGQCSLCFCKVLGSLLENGVMSTFFLFFASNFKKVFKKFSSLVSSSVEQLVKFGKMLCL